MKFICCRFNFSIRFVLALIYVSLLLHEKFTLTCFVFGVNSFDE